MTARRPPVPVRIPPGLLRRLDDRARELGISRSAAILAALRAWLDEPGE